MFKDVEHAPPHSGTEAGEPKIKSSSSLNMASRKKRQMRLSQSSETTKTNNAE